MSRYVYPSALCPLVGAEIELSGPQGHHLTRVLRAKVGEEIELINGKGEVARATILEVKKGKAVVCCREVNVAPPPFPLSLAFGYPKPAALDFIFRRGTEVGVSSFQPLFTDHSVSRSTFSTSKWDTVISEVCKQCQEAHFPSVFEPKPLKAWLEDLPPHSTLILCDSDSRDSIPKLSTQDASTAEKKSFSPIYWVLIGPEGGWSRQELQLFDSIKTSSHHTLTNLGLGSHRLRTELASILAVFLMRWTLETGKAQES